MEAVLDEFTLATQGDDDVLDVTLHAQKTIGNSGLQEGICTVFVAHSTCGVTIIEHEPGTVADLKRVLDTLTPADDPWEHNERNSDTNGHSHLRGAWFGPSVTIPFSGGQLLLGVWQKIVCIDFDDRPRSRRLIVQLLGV